MSEQALRAALAVAVLPPPPPAETVRYAPGDCALLIGPGAVLRKRLDGLAVAGLRPALLCTDDPAELPRGLRALAGEAADLEAIPTLATHLSDHPVAAGDDKRTLLFAAVDHLIGQAPATAPVSLPLPRGPLGQARVAAEKCTLCATCVRLCPTGAFSLPGSLGQLAFQEENCVQCGLCVAACPERVITLVPRLLTDRAARRAPRVVAEAEMVACAGCGKPFTTRAMLARSQALMADHPMFQGDNVRLMTLCPDCRQRAMAGVDPRG